MIRYDDRIIKILFSKEIKKYINISNSKEKYHDFKDIINVSEFIKIYKCVYPNNTQKDEIINVYEHYELKVKTKYNRFTFITLLKYISNSYFVHYGTNEIRVKYEEYMNWIGITNKINEDSIATLFIAENCVNLPHLNWFQNIKHDNEKLNKELSKEKAENHMHLNGSGINFLFNYYALFIEDSTSQTFSIKAHNFLNLKDTKTITTLNDDKFGIMDMYRLKSLRWYFQNKETYNKEKINVLINILEAEYCWELDSETKYEIFKTNVSSKKMKKFETKQDVFDFLQIEREFQIKTIKELDGNFEEYLYYLYLYYKNGFEQLLIERNKYDGFAYFKAFEERKDYFFSSPVFEYNYLFALIIQYAEYDNVTKLEFRTAPKSNAEDMVKKVRNIKKIVDLTGVNLEICNVIHYIKSESKKHSTKIQWQKQQGAVIRAMNYESLIVGVDTANYENKTTPDSYGYILRRHFEGQQNRYHPKLTNHAGEDFSTLLSGIRHIEENITFLPYTQGSRIGHCLALYLNADKYYKDNIIKVLTVEEYISNYVWLQQQLIEFRYEDFEFTYRLEKFVDAKLNWLSSEIKNKCGININVTLAEYFASMQLRSDNPNKYQKIDSLPNYDAIIRDSLHLPNPDYNMQNQLYKEALSIDNAKILNHMYHWNKEYKKIIYQKIEDNITNITSISTDEFIKSVNFVRLKMIELLDRKGIVSEVNLTSNYLITPLKKYGDHSLFEDKIKNEMVLCTDDSGVFNTSLYKEYSIFAKVLEEDYNLTQSEIIKEVKKMRIQSLEASFID